MTRPLRFIVCGTTFGRVHLAALHSNAPWGKLVGVLARGSDRSLACARQYGVPLYRSVEELPAEVDAAVVAVRAAVAGGTGSELAGQLLARGIHVLQEHPVHHDELAGLLRAARRHGVYYQLNNHYPQVDAVQRFIRAARALYRYGPPRFVEAATGIQVAFALFDLLGQALPSLRPWIFADPAPVAPSLRRLLDVPPPLRGLDGVLGGVPVHLRVHNQLNPADPDNHAHLLHRISIGTDAGTLTLANTHGPVLWSPRLHAVEQPQGGPTGTQPDNGPTGTQPGAGSALAQPSSEPIGPAVALPYADLLTATWPAAMRRTLADFAAAATGGEDPMRRGQYHLTLCRLWQDVTGRLGQPEMISSAPPPLVTAADLDPGPLDSEPDAAAGRAGTGAAAGCTTEVAADPDPGTTAELIRELT